MDFKKDKKNPEASKTLATTSTGSAQKRKSVNTHGKSFVSKPTLSDEQKRDLKIAFGEFDPRGLGMVNSRNFIISLRAMGFEPKCSNIAKFIERELGHSEKDMLDFKDYYHLMHSMMLEDESKAQIKQMFQNLCDEETGVITIDNLIQTAQELEANTTEEELHEMIKVASSSGEGTCVTQEDFIKIMEVKDLE